MISNKIIPVNILRLFIWNLLQQNTDMQTITGSNGASLIPIVPLEDSAELEDSGQPFIIYGYSEQYGGRGLREIRTGTLSLRISARTYSELGEITTTISRAFEQADVSAAVVNDWSSHYSLNGTTPFIDANGGIRFTQLDTSYVADGNAPDKEGGKYEGTINITYHYVSHQTVKLFKNGQWV
jgi:hypothetical protein